MSGGDTEIIVVRSLAGSDLGLFAAHRGDARSKQRAININAPVAQALLDDAGFKAGGATLQCTCLFGDIRVEGPRLLSKVHKNWRLGGSKIEGAEFGELDARDFALIRSPRHNDGSKPVTIAFYSRNSDRVVHAGIAAIVERHLNRSTALFDEGSDAFAGLSRYCPPAALPQAGRAGNGAPGPAPRPPAPALRPRAKSVPPMPRDDAGAQSPRTMEEKLRTPHILERMLQVSADLSAPAQLRFMDTVQQLAAGLRALLLETGGIVRLTRDHLATWQAVRGKPVGFVDGGLANLSMLGSAPIAARVGGYVVTPGDTTPARESFRMLKYLIDELYATEQAGVFRDSFPDIGALRDAARISIEAAGAVRLVSERPDLGWVMVHGALVNPVSRYTDVMRDEQVRHKFPDFSSGALAELLPPGEPQRTGRDANFVSVYLRQLELLQQSPAIVCGVVERESSTTSVIRAVLDSLDDHRLRDLLPMPPQEWKQWFKNAVDPSDDDEFEGQRITDPLLFRCVLEPGEALVPVSIDRNELRRAPKAWHDKIGQYPQPLVSYLQATPWTAPVRVETFPRDRERFTETANLIFHCALLLPRYAFPVGLDIVDKFAKVPDWMSRPVNTRTAVVALRRALDDQDAKLFDTLRTMLCGSGREWMLRPGVMR
ncbi:DNA double-strand break repair nuclease NurA [Gluconacetobacter azotocaptans]|uniref:DNA double-strand break repair nuclease NurA n=1 Tax=Gluconacetobacter azotocaptans TaxID=142834 RepID=UPI001958CAF4|nr:DNA double-strand break repair nuclease NurA [Gluconacetobacter azotocaptans]